MLSYRPGVPCLFLNLQLHLFFSYKSCHNIQPSCSACTHTEARSQAYVRLCLYLRAHASNAPTRILHLHRLGQPHQSQTTPGQTAPAHPVSLWTELRHPLCALRSHRQPDKTPHLREVHHHRTLECQTPTMRRGRATRLRRAAPPAAPHAAAKPRSEYCRWQYVHRDIKKIVGRGRVTNTSKECGHEAINR